MHVTLWCVLPTQRAGAREGQSRAPARSRSLTGMIDKHSGLAIIAASANAKSGVILHNHRNPLSGAHGTAWLYVNLLDDPIAGCQQRNLHFHGFQYHQNIPRLNPTSHRGLHLPKVAGNRAFDTLLALL